MPKFGIHVDNFGASWRDGRAFVALISALNPGKQIATTILMLTLWFIFSLYEFFVKMILSNRIKYCWGGLLGVWIHGNMSTVSRKKIVCKCFSVEMCWCADRKQNNFAHMNEVNFFLLTDKPNIIHLILICLANKLHLFTLNWNMYRKLKMHLWSAKNFVSWIVYTDLNLKFSWQTVSSLLHYKYRGLIIYLSNKLKMSSMDKYNLGPFEK